MPPPDETNWEIDPEYIELKNFLIERTRNARSPLSINHLATKFKEKSGSSQTIPCLVYRIRRLRGKAAELDRIDTATKVKMMYALSAPIDDSFLKKLQKDAQVDVDEKNRITKYRANDGSLELEGDHRQYAKKRMTSSNPIYDREYIELINFLIERTKDAKSPLNITHLAEEFKENSGSSQGISCLSSRIYKFRSEVHDLDSVDTVAKVRILFALSASIDEDFLKELRMNAHVELDNYNRITEYRVNDGSIELEADHSQSAKLKKRMTCHPNYDREYIELIDFLIERTKDSKSPLNVNQLIEEFKEKTGSSQEDGCISGRIYKFRSKIQQSDSIGTETKVKLLFGLSAHIDEDFLIELRMDAHVELDESNRISNYRAKDGSLELEGDHRTYAKMKMTSSDPNYDWELIELMNFLIERTKDAKSPLNITHLAEEFKENSGPSQGISCLSTRINKFRSEVHDLDSVDTVAKVRILFALSASVDGNFLNELQKDAHVEVDEKNRITKYRANDGSLELEGDHSQYAKPRKISSNPIYDREKAELMNFLIERTKDSNSPLNLTQLAEEFKETSGSSQVISCLAARIYRFPPKIHEFDSVDTETKVRIFFALSASVDEDFLEELRIDAHVEVDGKNRITKYKTKDGCFELEGDHSKNPNYDPKQVELLNFLIERTEDSKIPLLLPQLAEEFKEKSGSSQGVQWLVDRIVNVRSKIHKLDSIDRKRKVKMLLTLSASIDKNYLNELRQDANVEVDEKNRITKYIANDGSLELRGDHSKSAKMKRGWKRNRALKSQKNSDERTQDYMPKTSGSVKRAAPKVPTSSKKAKDSSPDRSMNTEDYDPNDSSRVPESTTKEPSNPGIQELRQPKEEDVPEAPNSKKGGAPRTTGSDIPQEKPIKTEPEADDGYVSRIKFLETIRSLVLNLDMPILTTLQTRIEKKIRESSSDAMISNDEMSLAMELLVAKITSQSVSILPENAESVRFSHFLCYLKTAILNSKLEGLKGLLEKINAKIKEPISKDKNIPVEEVASALHSILRATGF